MKSMIILNNRLAKLDPTFYFQLQENRGVTDFIASLQPLKGIPLEALNTLVDSSKYDYIVEVLDEEFTEICADFRRIGILDYEVSNLLTVCTPVFETLGFIEGEDNRMLRYAIIGTIAEYLEGEPVGGV